ncbi:hypothetical protein GCM10027073_65760 [Streptomyces chlorus]
MSIQPCLDFTHSAMCGSFSGQSVAVAPHLPFLREPGSRRQEHQECSELLLRGSSLAAVERLRTAQPWTT